MDRRMLLRATPLSLFGMGPGSIRWEDELSMLKRRDQLIKEFGKRDVSALAEILADIILRIEAIERG